MAKKNSNESYESYKTKKDYIECFYKKYRTAWDGIEGYDDRLLFCNMYDQIMKALEEMKKVNSPMIWVGFNNQVHQNEEIMKDIVDRWNK